VQHCPEGGGFPTPVPHRTGAALLQTQRAKGMVEDVMQKSRRWVEGPWRQLPPPPPSPPPPPQLSCDSRPLVLVSGVTALVAEISFAALGFGPAVMYEICWELFHIFKVGSGQLEEAVWNSLIMSSAVAVVQAFLLRGHMNTRVVLLMTLPLVAGLPLGTFFLEHFGSMPWMKPLLGVFFFAMIVIQRVSGAADRLRIEDLSLRACAWAGLAALVGGLSRGMFGISAPVAVLLLFFSVDRDLWRLVSAVHRIAIFLVQGPMLAQHLRPQWSCVPMYCTLVACGSVGMVLGNKAAPYISADDLKQWITLFLAAAGFLMLSDGHERMQLGAAAFSTAALAALVMSSALSVFQGQRAKDLSTQADGKPGET